MRDSLRSTALFVLVWLAGFGPLHAQESEPSSIDPVQEASDPASLSPEVASNDGAEAGPGDGELDPSKLPLDALLEGRAGDGETMSTAMTLFVVLTALSLLPFFLLTVTSFTRIVIVLSFMRRAVGITELPPNMVVIGMALFLTFFTMAPVFESAYDEALVPYSEGRIGLFAALDRACVPLRAYLSSQTKDRDVALFHAIAHQGDPSVDPPADMSEVPLRILIPAFVLSEVRIAFQMGFVLFLPFLIIDLVITSILISMGMFMMPPVVISTPLKVLLFVLVDGWDLLIGSLMSSFSV